MSSGISKSESHQQGRVSGSFASDQFQWHEGVSATLPLNFRTDLSYRYLKNTNIFGDTFTPGASRLSSISKDTEMNVNHRLNESLGTFYTFRYGSSSSTAGDSKIISNSLAVNYNKKIPWGLLQAGLNWGRSTTTTVGGTDIVNEPHTAVSVPGPFCWTSRISIR